MEAVGATVITDTLALVILAGVAGSATGQTRGLSLLLHIVLGMLLLAGWCFGVLPQATRWFFARTGDGEQRTVRFVFVLACFLSGAVLASVVGVEGIVGAFFTGLALNRLVAEDSLLLERTGFFGSALLIPLFLVSVGLIVDPAVMASPATLGLGAVFVVACIGGKALAAALTRPLLRFSRAEVATVFGLTVAQAAATLAATRIGQEIGLFSVRVVNAVLILIVASLLLASGFATAGARRVKQSAATADREATVVTAT